MEDSNQNPQDQKSNLSPEVAQLQQAAKFYSNALAIMANAEIQGYQAEAIYKTLQYFQQVKTQIEADIETQLKAVESEVLAQPESTDTDVRNYREVNRDAKG